MKSCAEFIETLLLDAHGELPPEERGGWERHLAGCADCRREQERLLAFIRTANEALSVPGLTSEQEQLLSGRVQRALRAHTPDVQPKRMGWVLAPAFAACMVLVVAGWFGLKNAGPDTAAIPIERVRVEAMRTMQELPENPGQVAAIPIERVPEEAISTTQELPGDSGQTASITSGPAEEQIPVVDKELLENFELLQEMESLEQLVNLLDKQEQKTSLLERGSNADRFNGHV